MFIRNLTIRRGEKIIRSIDFKHGINLIIDETHKTDKSGNNVGKTTVLRLIDYCLGGSGENIYTDSEFKGEGESLVGSYLKDNKILISLMLVGSFDDNLNKDKVFIERNFLEGSENILRINGKQYDNLKTGFCPKLSELIFDYKEDKPSFRQIISKNIRDEKNRLKNTLKVLHSTTKSEEYESLYLFWLGVRNDSFSEKQKLQGKKNIESHFQARLKKEGSLSEIKQALIVISKKIRQIEDWKKKGMGLNENYESDLNKLSSLKSEISKVSTGLNQLRLRKELISESKTNLENETSSVNLENIKQFYSEAKILIPNLQKSFEETVAFHNQMISEKISYLTEELPSLDVSISEASEKLSKLISEEEDFSKRVVNSDEFKNLEDLILELNKLYEQKGKLEERVDLWVESQNKLKELNDQLVEINKSIAGQDDLIQERLTLFNEFFAKVSNELYGESFILSSDKNKKGCYELKISNLSGNLGTGKKKVQIAAFDFAYIDFADSLGIECLHFILHDQIENVHDNQINKILNKIVNERNCQYIVPVLRDKLPSDIDVSSMEVLSLSESDKLFRIENSPKS